MMLSLLSSAPVITVPAKAADIPITISQQPALWAVAFQIATEQGYWKEAGLAPTFKMFASGAPQIAAGAAKDWDVGALGAPPAVLGAARFGLVTIAMADEEGAGNAVLARKDDIAKIRKDPVGTLKGQSFLVSTNSTGEFASWACLQTMGLKRSDMQFVNLSPPQLVSAFANGTGILAGTWTPNIFTLHKQAGAEVVCNGRDAGLIITSNLVTRADFAKENPDAVARFLAVYLRAVAWQHKNPDKFAAILKTFYEKNGVLLDENYIKEDIKVRPQYTLSTQIGYFDRSSGASRLDTSFENFMDYLVSTGTLKKKLDVKSFITPQYLKAVNDDPKLKAFANGE